MFYYTGTYSIVSDYMFYYTGTNSIYSRGQPHKCTVWNISNNYGDIELVTAEWWAACIRSRRSRYMKRVCNRNRQNNLYKVYDKAVYIFSYFNLLVCHGCNISNMFASAQKTTQCIPPVGHGKQEHKLVSYDPCWYLELHDIHLCAEKSQNVQKKLHVKFY